MSDDMTTEQRLELLRQAARISPILRECVDGVVDEVERLTAALAAVRRDYLAAVKAGQTLERLLDEKLGELVAQDRQIERLRRVAEAAEAYHAAFDNWPDGGWTTVASLQRAEKQALAAWREVKA